MTEVKAVIGSVLVIPFKVIKPLPTGYQIPDPLPWAQLAGPLAAAEDALARLDERLAKSPIREGWIAALILPMPAPVCGSTANWSISKISFSTTPAWISAPRPTS